MDETVVFRKKYNVEDDASCTVTFLYFVILELQMEKDFSLRQTELIIAHSLARRYVEVTIQLLLHRARSIPLPIQHRNLQCGPQLSILHPHLCAYFAHTTVLYEISLTDTDIITKRRSFDSMRDRGGGEDLTYVTLNHVIPNLWPF